MDNARLNRAPGILLLFARGGRPDVAAVRVAVDKLAGIGISHDPVQAATNLSAAEGNWLELLSHGLTFDLTGLSPDHPITLPETRHQFDVSGDMTNADYEAVRLAPGPHLVGGEKTLPVVRRMLGLAADLSKVLPGVRAYCWPPSASLVGPEFFRATVGAWVDGGAFPALGITAFKSLPGGGLQSEGLSYFTGQEIWLEGDSSGDNTAISHLALRLVNQLVQHGHLDQTEAVTAPDGGQLRLQPSPDGKTIKVSRS